MPFRNMDAQVSWEDSDTSKFAKRESEALRPQTEAGPCCGNHLHRMPGSAPHPIFREAEKVG